MREQLRPNAFLRLVENRWVSSETTFINMDWWDDCVDLDARPEVWNRRLPLWVGIDASVKRDSTAIVGCTYAVGMVRLVLHRMFQPSTDEPLDFAQTIEATVQGWSRAFGPREVKCDPYQMQASAQRLQAMGIPMVEFPQTVGNLTEASSKLYELIKGRNLVAYRDAELRLAVQRSVALETPRGWRIAKKASHKIDVVVALAQAALGAVQAAAGGMMVITPEILEAARRFRRHDYGPYGSLVGRFR